ncbi:hypothetical protein [Megamonas funiformis]|uniref:hypothetical protein n=1 Tax=Megamonas funiformis TaxID=437897 RepID=UPI00265F6744|nr:hypothetical protein [Megamonas funiformis]
MKKFAILSFFILFNLLFLVGCGEDSPNIDTSTPEGKLEQSVRTELENYGGTLVTFRDIQVLDSGVDDKKLIVVNCNGTILDNKLNTIKEYNIAIAHIVKAIYTSEIPIKNCTIAIWSDVVNTKTGEESNINSYTLVIPPQNTEKIKWENIDSIDITKNATNIEVHSVLRK